MNDGMHGLFWPELTLCIRGTLVMNLLKAPNVALVEDCYNPALFGIIPP